MRPDVRNAAAFVLLISGMVFAAETAPSPPKHVKAERQDFQAARISWDAMGKNIRYQLYAAYDKKPLDFYKEHDGRPIAETFAIWDAPRGKSRRFVFYVTAIDPQGRESAPSKQVHVDLGPLPSLPTP